MYEEGWSEGERERKEKRNMGGWLGMLKDREVGRWGGGVGRKKAINQDGWVARSMDR